MTRQQGRTARRAGAAVARAAVWVVGVAAGLAACGGGGSGPAPEAPLVVSEYNAPTGTGPSTAARHGGVGLNVYSQARTARLTGVQADAGLLTLTGQVPAGSAYAGIQAVLYPPNSTYDPQTGQGRVVPQDYAGQSELRVVAASADTQQLQVQLIPKGGPFNGCVPTAQLPVSATPAERTLALDDSVWVVPSHCSPQERSLTLAATLAQLAFIDVGITEQQVAGLADGRVRGFTLGKVSFAGVAAPPAGAGPGNPSPGPVAPLVVSEYNEPTGEGTSTAARHGGVNLVAFSQHDDAQVTEAASGAGLVTLSGRLPAGNAWGGIEVQMNPPRSTVYEPGVGPGHVAPQNYAAQTELRVVAASADTQRLKVQLIPQGGPFNGCVPTAQLPVGATVAEHVLPLDPSLWVVPAYCTVDERRLTLATALAHLAFINVGITEQQVAGLADGLARSFSVGRLSFAGPAAAPIDYDEVVLVHNRPIGEGDSLAALYGGMALDLFSDAGDASSGPVTADFAQVTVNVTVPAGNTFGGALLQLFSPGSTWVPRREDIGQGTGTVVPGRYENVRRLRIQVGSRSADRVTVRLVPVGGPLSDCVPTFVLPVDALVVSRDVALADPGWFVPEQCTEQQRSRTPAEAAANLQMVAVGLTERSMALDGQAREFTLGEVAFVR